MNVHSTAIELRSKYEGSVAMDIHVDMAKIKPAMRTKIANALRAGIYPSLNTVEAKLYEALADLAGIPALMVKQGKAMPEAISGRKNPRNYSWYLSGNQVPEAAIEKLNELLQADFVGSQLRDGSEGHNDRPRKLKPGDFYRVRFTTIKSMQHLKDALVHVNTPEYQAVAQFVAQKVVAGETVHFKGQ